MTFQTEARAAAVAWKQVSPALPEGARAPGMYRGKGPYPFCLPEAYAEHNVLPEAREVALDRFRRAKIPWHGTVNRGPSTHLLSSQVQCANALAPMVRDHERLAAFLRRAVDVRRVLPLGHPGLADTDMVGFEYIGMKDHLRERGGGAGVQGALTTSADAAVRYQAPDGRVEIALIEWKYTERYTAQRLHGSTSSAAVRHERYSAWWQDPDGPLRKDVLAYEELFAEPLYQLMRLQALALAMERDRELDADVVRVVYAAPSTNAELWSSLTRPAYLEVEPDGHLLTLWRKMQRRPDRFAYLDTGHLIAADDGLASREYSARYGHQVAAEVEAPVLDDADALEAGDARVERLRAALQHALIVLQRIAADGGVLSQLDALSDEELATMPPDLLDETTARLEELATLGQTVRAEPVRQLLYPE